MKAALTFAGAALLALAACDGPRENAGEQADNASGAVDGEDSMQSGPAETLGERQDHTADSINDAKEARADALEAEADQQREEAEQQADALDERAKQVRGQ